MTDPRNRRFAQDPFAAFFDPKTWDRIERQITGGIEKAFRGIALRKEDEVVKEATETEPAETRQVLVASLDVPGVPKENISIEFAELDYGFTRLSITTQRGDADKNLFKVEFRESVVADGASATLELGVLTVRVPVKADDTKSKFEVPVV